MHTIGDIPLTIRRIRRARNYTLSYNATRSEALLTLPLRASLSAGLAFAQSRAQWLLDRKKEYPPQETFRPNLTLPVLGSDVTFVHQSGRGLTTREGNQVIIRGDADFFARRMGEWINTALLEALKQEVAACVETLKIQRNIKIQVKSMRSRWGSCAPSGKLAFSSRLAFAPPSVVRYLAAHECAHLVHADHSPRFWSVVKQLYPDYPLARLWLREHGRELSRFG
jgi:predicted metal-dependent hydrolase